MIRVEKEVPVFPEVKQFLESCVIPSEGSHADEGSLPIGLIAGMGFPILIAQAARQAGKRMIAVAHLGETQPELEPWVESLHWIRLGEFGKLIKIFQKEAVNQVILAGGIDKKKMFSRVRPDLKGLC